MNLEKIVGLVFIILMGLIIFIFVLSPQPKYQDSISYLLAPDARNISHSDFDTYAVRVNVFENEENASNLVKKIEKWSFPAYLEVLPNSDLTAVYVGPFLAKEDIEKNIEFIYEISETDSGEIVLSKH